MCQMFPNWKNWTAFTVTTEDIMDTIYIHFLFIHKTYSNKTWYVCSHKIRIFKSYNDS